MGQRPSRAWASDQGQPQGLGDPHLPAGRCRDPAGRFGALRPQPRSAGGAGLRAEPAAGAAGSATGNLRERGAQPSERQQEAAALGGSEAQGPPEPAGARPLHLASPPTLSPASVSAARRERYRVTSPGPFETPLNPRTSPRYSVPPLGGALIRGGRCRGWGRPQFAVCWGRSPRQSALPPFLRPPGKPDKRGSFPGHLPCRFPSVASLECRT